MTAPTPPATHEEIDFLDEIERALVALTTADLAGVAAPGSDADCAQPAPALPPTALGG